MANGQLLGFIDSGQDLNGQLRNNGDEIIGEVSASGQVLGALIGQSGKQGVGIRSIIKTGTSGLIDTYTITYTNNTTSTFEVTNGQQGNPGATGNGVSNIAKTSSAGLVDTYTITYTNGDTDTFTVTNGAGGAWGSITGTLAEQTDLKNALDDKIDKSLTAGLVKNDGTIDTTPYSTFSGAYGDLTGTPTIPENTSDLNNDSGFIDNTVNNLVNYFKKADNTLPIYFVNASEHSTSGTAFNFAEKPVGLYLFLPNSTTPFDLYIKPRAGATETSILSALVFAVHIKNVLPSVYVSNQTNYACSVLSDGKYRTYELVDENNDFDSTWVTTTFLTTGENNTITGQLTFSTIPKTSVTPTNNDHLARKGYVDNQAIKQDLSTAGIEDYSSLSTYTVGNYVSYNNLIYKCNTAITTPEEWNNTHWTQKTYLEYLSDSISSGTVNDSTITIQKGGVTVDSFTTNAANNKTINIPATITESGSNSNGRYVKYSDGTMICWKWYETPGNIPISTSWGSGYTSGDNNLVSLGNFAATFYSKPVVNVTLARSGGYNAWLGAINGTSTTYVGDVTLLRFTSNSGVKYGFNIIAIGRWKA